jgi:integrase
MKVRLTDRGIQALKPKASPYRVMDTDVGGGFGVAVHPSGAKSFVLYRRFGSTSPSCRTLGQYPVLSLSAAREKAREWIAMVQKGLDPAHEAKRTAEAEKARQAKTFGGTLSTYIDFQRRQKRRSVKKVEREMRRELASWLDRPLSDITADDVRRLISGIVRRGLAGQARVTLANVRAFFNWCVDCGELPVSPCASVKTAGLVPERMIRDRTLSDGELRCFWRAAERLDYPAGPYFKLLVLTALRRMEVAAATWAEIDLRNGLWTVPALRMKSGKPHTVPLVGDIPALLESLPRNESGFLFSTGMRPIAGFGRLKAALDAAMKLELAAEGLNFEPWTIHDLRRSCRTHFSTLTTFETAELLLAHSRPGLHRTYDKHTYDREKAAALTAWHDRLRHIVNPVDNVVPFRAA